MILVTLLAGGLAACSAPTSSTPPVATTPSEAPSSSPSTGTDAPAPATSQSSGSTQPPVITGTGVVDACALLSTSDLAGIVDGMVDAGRAMPSGGWIAGQCAWSAPTAGFELSVGTATSIAAFADAAAPDAKAQLAAFSKAADGAGGQPKDVAGIGDGAVLAASGIAAFKGDTYLEIMNLGLTDDQLVQIAKLAVGRL